MVQVCAKMHRWLLLGFRASFVQSKHCQLLKWDLSMCNCFFCLHDSSFTSHFFFYILPHVLTNSILASSHSPANSPPSYDHDQLGRMRANICFFWALWSQTLHVLNCCSCCITDQCNTFSGPSFLSMQLYAKVWAPWPNYTFYWFLKWTQPLLQTSFKKMCKC